MQNKIRRMAAFLLSVMVFSASLCVISTAEIAADPKPPLFIDDFNSYGNNPSGVANKNAMIAKGWNTPNNTTGNYNTGENFTVPYTAAPNLYLENLDGASDWENYSVECTINFVYDEAATGSTSAGVSARVQAAGAKSGYDFLAIKASVTAAATVLRLRCDGNKLVDDVTVKSILVGTPFTLKMELAGTLIRCYLNGEVIMTHDTKDDETAYSKGPCGFRKGSSTGYAVSFDDFTVYEVEPEYTPDFSDTFEDTGSMTENGWSTDSAGVKSAGAYTLNGGAAVYANNVSGNKSEKWKDYAVEADAVFSESSAVGADSAAGIVARATDGASGYAFLMKETASGQTGFALLKLGSDSGAINGSVRETQVALARGTAYHLRLIVSEGRVIAYCGEEQVFDVIDADPFTAGFPGLYSAGGCECIFDNFIVRTVTQDDLKIVYPRGYYYYDEFTSHDTMTAFGWSSDAGEKSAGYYTCAPGSAVYLSKLEGSVSWTDYAVEAVLAINEGENTATTNARIVARSTKTSSAGYEFGAADDPKTGLTYLQLYKRGAAGGKIAKKEYKMNMSILRGDFHTYKMVVLGSKIFCYFDGMKIFEVEDTDEPYLTGYAGMRSPGSADAVCGFTVDTYAVREIRDSDIVEEKSILKNDGDIWFFDSFNGESSLSERGWSTDSMNFYNGMVQVSGPLYTSGVLGSESWTDYEACVDVTIDKETGLLGSATSGVAAICIRSHGSTSGYEYGVLTAQSGAQSLRLYDRKNKTTLETNSTITVSEGKHTLRVLCYGNVIQCYFDGELAITARSDVNTAGYAGIRAAGYTTYYDNFRVGAITSESAKAMEGLVSPLTGVLEKAHKLALPTAGICFIAALVAGWITVSRRRHSGSK